MRCWYAPDAKLALKLANFRLLLVAQMVSAEICFGGEERLMATRAQRYPAHQWLCPATDARRDNVRQRCCGLQGVIINQHAVRLFKTADRPRRIMVASAALGSLTSPAGSGATGRHLSRSIFCIRPGGGGDGFQFAARQRRFEQVEISSPPCWLPAPIRVCASS